MRGGDANKVIDRHAHHNTPLPPPLFIVKRNAQCTVEGQMEINRLLRLTCDAVPRPLRKRQVLVAVMASLTGN